MVAVIFTKTPVNLPLIYAEISKFSACGGQNGGGYFFKISGARKKIAAVINF